MCSGDFSLPALRQKGVPQSDAYATWKKCVTNGAVAEPACDSSCLHLLAGERNKQPAPAIQTRIPKYKKNHEAQGLPKMPPHSLSRSARSVGLFSQSTRKPRITALYHYFHPDDVVSARHYSDLSLGLVARGWEVEVMPCNRGCRDERKTYPLYEEWRGISIRRVWRPRLPQASSMGRILNALWMVVAWCRIAIQPENRMPDVLVIGTGPILSVLVALVVKVLRPQMQNAHWVFDLYPGAAIADNWVRKESGLVRLLRPLIRRAYGSCDLIADLGPCMGERLALYGAPRRQITLVPWAIVEPDAVQAPNPRIRHQLFGDARLAVLYAGNFGRAHCHEEFLELARAVNGSGIHFCFAVRGNCVQELKSAIRPEDTNITFADFAAESELPARLAAADVHLASLRPGWTGIVVPSKFFGSLAAGRPVIFAGEPHSAIARWIRRHNVG